MNFHVPSRPIALLLACVFLSLAVGCSRPSSSALEVGINPWPGYEFLYLAQAKGFYRDEGIEVQIVEFSSLSDNRRERLLMKPMGVQTLLGVLDQFIEFQPDDVG